MNFVDDSTLYWDKKEKNTARNILGSGFKKEKENKEAYKEKLKVDASMWIKLCVHRVLRVAAWECCM